MSLKHGSAYSKARRLTRNLRDAVSRTVEHVFGNEKWSRRFLPRADLIRILNYSSLEVLFTELLFEQNFAGEIDTFVTRCIEATLGTPSRMSLFALFLYEDNDRLLSLYLEWMDFLLNDIPADDDRLIPSDDSMPFTTETLTQSGIPKRYHRSILENQAIFKPVTLRQLKHHEINTLERLPFIERKDPYSLGDLVMAEIAPCHWEIQEDNDFVPGNPYSPKAITLKTFKAVETVCDMNEATQDFMIELNILKELRNSEIKHDMILLDLGSITILGEDEIPIAHSLIFDFPDFSLDVFLKTQHCAQGHIGQSRLLRRLVDIVEALSFLHDRLDILHLDIELDNILVFENHVRSGSESQYDQIWKLSNFGLARKKAARQTDTSAQALTATSPVFAMLAARSAGPYQAPEIQDDDFSQAGRGSDVWSVGCITLMVLAFMIGGSNAVRELESNVLKSSRFYTTTHSYEWKHRIRHEAFYLRHPVHHEDFVTSTKILRLAALKPTLIAWSNTLLLEYCVQQVQQQFVLGVLKVIFGEVLRIDHDKRMTASALFDKLAGVQKNWELHELTPGKYPYRDISTTLCLWESADFEEHEAALEPWKNQIQKELFSAIERHEEDNVRLLLEQNPEILSQPHPATDTYPIHWALCMKAYEAFDVLLEKATPEITNIANANNGRTVLDFACSPGDPAALECIRKHREKFIFPRQVYENYKWTLGREAKRIADDLFGIKIKRVVPSNKSSLDVFEMRLNETRKKRRLVAQNAQRDERHDSPHTVTSEWNRELESEQHQQAQKTQRNSEFILPNAQSTVLDSKEHVSKIDKIDNPGRSTLEEDSSEEEEWTRPYQAKKIRWSANFFARSYSESDEGDSIHSSDADNLIEEKAITDEPEAYQKPRIRFRHLRFPREEASNVKSHPTDMTTCAINTPYRIYWSCSCGHKDFDNFIETVPGAVDKLANLLRANGVQSHVEVRPSESRAFQLYRLYLPIRNMIIRHSRAAKTFFQAVSRPSTVHPSASGSAGLPVSMNSPPKTSGGKQTTQPTSTVRNIRSQSSASGSAQTIAAQRQQPLPSSQNDYMLLCADEQGWLTSWEDLDVSPIRSDRELFDSFHKRIEKRKRWIHKFASLKTIQRISFVKASSPSYLRYNIVVIEKDTPLTKSQFALRQNQEVDQLQHDEIPPPAETHYDFHERVPGHVPPIGNRFFMHRFSNSAHCGVSTYCLSQIPKRVRGRPQYGSAPDHFTAWGLYFHENFDMARLCLCGIVMFLISFVFGVVWAAEKKSIQDGFAVASYILALEALTVGTVQVGIGLDWI